MRVSYSGVQCKKTNTSYPLIAEITSAADLEQVVTFDHVCAIYHDGYNQRKCFIKDYRSNKTSAEADCLPFDCDNTPTDPLGKDLDASNWKTPSDVAATYPDVCFYVVYSRNHMKDKDRRSAHPRFHVYFPLHLRRVPPRPITV